MNANPLSKFVQVEERPDGVYIKISRTEKDRIKIEEMIQALDQSLVINYDETRITEVFNHARGGFEKIGPHFEYYDPEMEQYLQFSITLERVTLSILPAASSAGVHFTEKKLAYFLLREECAAWDQA